MLEEKDIIVQFINEVMDTLGDGYEVVAWDASPNEDYVPNSGWNDSFIFMVVKVPRYEGQDVPEAEADHIQRVVSKVGSRYETDEFDPLDTPAAPGCVDLWSTIASDEQRYEENWRPSVPKKISHDRLVDISAACESYYP